jgi:adenylate cyclase
VSERAQRQLSAILAADVAGYSRLVGLDEEGTLSRLKALRRTLIDPKIEEHRGRIVKTMGDGLLVQFASAVDAVRCAVDIQHQLAEQNAGIDEGQRIDFRIGINVGDVVIDGEDIHGDGVNVAARLQALSEPGSICVSNSVCEQVRDKLDLTFEDTGEQTLKNIARPVRVYRLRFEATSKPPDFMPSDKPSIVVLPFANMSGDVEQQYFSDGITEDIITELSRFRSLLVIARNSSFQYRAATRVSILLTGRPLSAKK